MFNDNKGAVDWSQGCSILKKLCHLNIREISVLDAQNAGYVDIKHLPGHSNVSDIFTKEHKSDETFTQLAFQLIRPRNLSNKWTDILTTPTSDLGGCWKESGIVDILPPGSMRIGTLPLITKYNSQLNFSRFRRHVLQMAPMLVAPLVVLQASLCHLHFLVGCCMSLSSLPCFSF
jgi:hypothetical protein